ncbi:MAG TPA: gamma-glutamyltransferase [Gemmatimonadales bacterium]|nr:gamma-glutamyltransferase [Gemmatimonadales bacterium]
MRRSLTASALLFLLPACAGPSPSGVNPEWKLAGQARITEASSAVVVSGSPIASAVGRDILQQGGNAVDAAVAVGFALAVVHPEAGNIGGGGFLIYREATGPVYALDYREEAPSGASRDMYLEPDGDPSDLSVTGALAAAVPGSPAGLVEMHRRFGKLPFAQVINPAIELANQGFLVDTFRYESIGDNMSRLYLFPASRAQFLPGNQPPKPGTTLVQPDLGRTLEAIRDKGAAGFYTGRVADLIVAEMERSGGLISHADLAAYKPYWRDPIVVPYRGDTIYSMPPASSGGTTMGMILNMVEGTSPLPPFGSPQLMHLEAEAMSRAFMDRNAYMGDPGFVHNPVDQMLSKSYAAERIGTMDPKRASKTGEVLPGLKDGPSTTHYSVVDADGNAASITTTLNNSYGSAVTVTGAGFLLNDEMDDLASAPGKPNMYGLIQGDSNAIQPGKRPLSAMTPSVVVDQDGQLLLVVGTPGGPRIITMVYHVISNVLDHQMTLPDAVTAPRLHHQGLPNVIRVERGGFTPGAIAELERMGHVVSEGGYTGDIEAIIRTPTGWQGVSDPRLGGAGAGY